MSEHQHSEDVHQSRMSAERALVKVEQTEASVLLHLTRLEAKVDVALTQQGARIESHGSELRDHEARLRMLETRPHLKPQVVWSLLTIALAIVSLEIAFIGMRIT